MGMVLLVPVPAMLLGVHRGLHAAGYLEGNLLPELTGACGWRIPHCNRADQLMAWWQKPGGAYLA